MGYNTVFVFPENIGGEPSIPIFKKYQRGAPLSKIIIFLIMV